METIFNELRKEGYVASPNNIHGLPGIIAYAGGPGIPTVGGGLEIQCETDRIRIFKPVFFGKHYSRESYWDTQTIAVFATVESFINYCKAHGRISEPGQCGLYD